MGALHWSSGSHTTPPWPHPQCAALQGATFALAWSAGTLHVKRLSPLHLRGTVQSIFAGLYTGVGAGLGGLVGGLLYGPPRLCRPLPHRRPRPGRWLAGHRGSAAPLGRQGSRRACGVLFERRSTAGGCAWGVQHRGRAGQQRGERGCGAAAWVTLSHCCCVVLCWTCSILKPPVSCYTCELLHRLAARS